uniref:PRORP domain-containing protein n=1 Tax=Elaeophora elaphi TaxID=1147741 RepID=A0A0R3RZ80_9BILA
MSDATGLKASREQCYQSRDEYFKCCEEYKTYSESKCRKLKEKFEKDCPASWVPHFIRKHNYEKYKQKLVDEGVLLTEVNDAKLNIGGDRLFHVTCNVVASSIVSSGTTVCSKQNSSPKFPRTNVEKLAHCGCINDALHGVSVEQFCERMKMFGSMKYLDALRVLKDVRYLKTGRVLLRHLCSSSPSLPAYVVLEMVEMLACIHMEGITERGDEELWRQLLLLTNKVPYFLKPTVSLLLKSCCPVNVMPKLPSNLMLRPVVVTALLANYIRFGKISLFQTLLAKEKSYDLFKNNQLLRVLALHTNSHLAVSSTYLQHLSQQSVTLLGDNMWHFNSIIGQSKYWDIRNTSVSGNGDCCICGGKFKKNEDLSEMEFSSLRSEIMKYLSDDMQVFSSATDQEISDLKKHIKQKIKSAEDRQSLVVDALNVLYTSINNVRFKYGTDEVLQKSLNIFANVLLIVRKGGDTNRVWNENDRFSDSRLSAFFCHRMSSDDLFVLLAVMELGINAYFLTNDSFINHRNMLTPSGQLLFDKWIERRAVRLNNRDVIMPSKFAPYVHETDTGYHIPVKTVNKSVASYSFLCVRRKHVQ